VCSAAAAAEASEAAPVEKFRLDNLSPQKGSRRRPKRKGRGISAGQGASCGFGMRGQKSRSGPGVRRGFEGGQMPLYRRLPKLRGIAGGEPPQSKRFLPPSVLQPYALTYIVYTHLCNTHCSYIMCSIRLELYHALRTLGMPVIGK
jgi:hypothetical protein